MENTKSLTPKHDFFNKELANIKCPSCNCYRTINDFMKVGRKLKCCKKCRDHAINYRTKLKNKKEYDNLKRNSIRMQLNHEIRQVYSDNLERKQKELEKQQELEKQELDRQKQNEIEKQRELQKQKELQEQKELQKEKELQKQKELQEQKELQKQKVLHRQQELQRQKELQENQEKLQNELQKESNKKNVNLNMFSYYDSLMSEEFI